MIIYLGVTFVSQTLHVEGLYTRHHEMISTCVKLVPETQWRGVWYCHSEIRRLVGKCTVLLVRVAVE